MFFFHTIGVYCLGIALFLARPFHKKANQWWIGRKGFWKRLPEISSREVVWFHCASLGEFDQGLPVMKRLKEENPAIFLIVTFFSPSGMEHYHKRNHPADWVDYLPFPSPRNAKRFIRYFQPKTIFFVKYEFWANYLFQAKKHSAKNYCISANFRPNQVYFGAFKPIFSPVLFLFDKIFVQNQASQKLLESIEYKRTVIAGDTRIDQVLENKTSILRDSIAEDFLQGETAILLGSSWPIGEEKWKAYIQQHPEQKFMIAPHDISSKHIDDLMKMFPSAVRYTQFSKEKAENILLIDCIGQLSNLYQYAQLAYVGGGFTGSLHNILEAAVFEIPVLIGPKYTKFPEAEQLIQQGVVFSFQEGVEIESILQKIDPQKVKEAAHQFFESNKNVVGKIIENIHS